jgi:hypothetical protein
LNVQLVVTSEGEGMLTHRTPAGLALTHKRGDAWVTTALIDEDLSPDLVLGPSDEPYVYYEVDSNWDWYQPDELRRVRAGSCEP